MPTKRYPFTFKLILLAVMLLGALSCGKSDSAVSGPEDVTNQIDETDHSSDVPNDPIFKSKS